MEINRKPLYVMVYEELKEKIISGVYLEGDELPSEKALQDEYGVSRITIRNATERLSLEGLIDKKSGKSTTVVNTKEVVRLKATTGFSYDNKDQKVHSVLKDFEIIPANYKISKFLGININEEIYKIARERYINDKLVTLQVAYVPTKLLKLTEKDFESHSSSLFDKFHKNNITPAKADELYSMIISDEQISSYMQVPLKSPLLFIERITFDQNGNGIEYVENYYQTERYKYSVSFGENV